MVTLTIKFSGESNKHGVIITFCFYSVHTMHIPCTIHTYNMSLKSNTSVPLKSIMALRAGRVGKVGYVKVL